MKNVFVLAEHRKGQLRDTTWEALTVGRKLAADLSADLTCLLLGGDVNDMAQKLAQECANVLVVDDAKFAHFDSDALLKAIPKLLADKGPYILLMGNSNSVLDLAPGLSVVLDAACATDCPGVEIKDGKPVAYRQVYSYKVNSEVTFKDAERIVITLRAGSNPYTLSGGANGQIQTVPSPIADEPVRKRFLEYVEAEKGDVDVASAEIIVSIGRGIGDEPDMDIFQSLADTMGGVIACSRPIVDKGLLPKYHQVGTSGVEVKPKVYLALGISGAFQHVGGIKGSPLIVAINKDARAPIFRVAQYGIVGDVNEVVPVLDEKIQEIKG